MGSRVEKLKLIRKERRKKRTKGIIIVLSLFLLYYGIKMVNDHIEYLGYLDNPIILDIDMEQGKLYLFGESYLIDLKILKRDQ